MRHDLFISYAGADRTILVTDRPVAFISHLKRVLERHRVPRQGKRAATPFRVCTYEDDFEVGRPLPEEIRFQLDHSASLLVICSPAAAVRSYVRLEVEHFTRAHPDRPVVGGRLDLAPHFCFPGYFPRDIIVADLGCETERSMAAWKRKVEAESHKIVAASLKLPVAEVHDRFALARLRRRLLVSAGAMLFLIATLLAGLQYGRFRSEVRSREARSYLEKKGVEFEAWGEKGLWVRAFKARGFGDRDLLRLAAVPGVSNLQLGGTLITESALPELARRTELTVLGLESTRLIPSRLSQLRALKRLERLDLSGIALTDADIEFLPALPRLSELTLNATLITDRAVDAITRLPALRELNLEKTAIGDAGVAKLSALKGLTWLTLDGTKVTDEALPDLAALPLRALGLNSTAVTSRSGPVLLRMAGLEKLWIANTAIDFPTVMGFARLNHLKFLVVHEDQFSERQLASLKARFGDALYPVDWERSRH